MELKQELSREGNWLFTHRSYLPLPFYAGALALMATLGAGSSESAKWVEEVWDQGCFALALLGAVVRFHIAGTVPPRTSGRNTSGQLAEELNTTGWYSVVRHPLYLGNFLIYLAIALYPRTWWFAGFFVLSFWLYYERIMCAEESFLAERFGAAFTAWAAKTRAFLPSRKGWIRASRPFSFKQGLIKERTTILGVAVAFAGLELAEHLAARELDGMDWFWAALVLLAMAIYAVAKWSQKARPAPGTPG